MTKIAPKVWAYLITKMKLWHLTVPDLKQELTEPGSSKSNTYSISAIVRGHPEISYFIVSVLIIKVSVQEHD